MDEQGAVDHPFDLQNPDEARPAKRVRLEAPLDITTELQDEMNDEDDWDDIYADSANATLAPNPTSNEGSTLPASDSLPPTADAPTCDALSQGEHQYGVSTQVHALKDEPMGDGVPAEAISHGDDLVAPQQTSVENGDKTALDVLEETTQMEMAPVVETESTTDGDETRLHESTNITQAEPDSTLR